MTLPFLQLLALVMLAAMMLWAQGQSVLPPDQHAALMAVYDATGPCQFFSSAKPILTFRLKLHAQGARRRIVFDLRRMRLVRFLDMSL